MTQYAYVENQLMNGKYLTQKVAIATAGIGRLAPVIDELRKTDVFHNIGQYVHTELEAHINPVTRKKGIHAKYYAVNIPVQLQGMNAGQVHRHMMDEFYGLHPRDFAGVVI